MGCDETDKPRRPQWLAVLNCVIAFAHFFVALLVWYDKGDWKVALTTTFLDWRYPSDNDSSIAYHDDEIPILVPVSLRLDLPRLSLTSLVFIFHILSGLWQFLVFAVVPMRRFYYAELEKNRNALRWIEYAVTAPCMIIVIAVLMGQSDAVILFLLQWSTFTLMLLGLLTERLRNKNKNRGLSHAIGWIIHFTTWLCITFTFFYSMYDGTHRPPVRFRPLLYGTFFGMQTLFGCFGIVQLVSVVSPRISFYTIEASYAVLSLVSKITLGVLVWYFIKVRDDLGIRMI
ncbi:MAG: hypothetical protein QMC37_09295 [Flavobacteriales bacterium]